MSFPSREADWLSVPDALQRIRAAARPLPPEAVPLAESVGRALATDVVAPTALPPWDNSAMDGYAVRGQDLDDVRPDHPRRLQVVGESLPGRAWDGVLGPGEAVRIMTGAPVPNGADSVVRVEHTGDRSDTEVEIERADDRGRNVRPAGEDMAAGDTVAVAGAAIGAGHVAVLASCGHAAVEVVRQPRVGVLTTGDELVPPEAFAKVLSGHAIVDSNGPMLASQVVEAGGVPVLLGPAGDSVESLRGPIEAARSLDVLVTVGGASMGTHDLVKRVLDDAGYRLEFWRVRIRPGSPFSFGWLDGRAGADVPVFGLPGNPASAFVTFELFVRPYLRARAGFTGTERPRVRAVAEEDLRSPENLTAYHRVVLTPTASGFGARLTGPQGSGLVRGLAQADGLAVLPEGAALVAAGSEIEVILMRERA